jgi:hypothetical protein
MGKRLGKKMKDVGKAINSLTHGDLATFMTTGTITVAGFELDREDLLVKRDFNGDSKKYEAAVSDDGRLLVAIDTSADPEIISELRARTLAANVQKMRKAAGLLVEEPIEVYYEEIVKGKGKSGLVADALRQFAEPTIRRIASLPLPAALMPACANVVAREKIKDADLSDNAVILTLIRPSVAINTAAVDLAQLCIDTNTAPATVAMYVHTKDVDTVLSSSLLTLSLGGQTLELKRDTHFFPSTKAMLLALPALRDAHSLPDTL